MSDKKLSQVPEKPHYPLPGTPPSRSRVTKVEVVWPGKYNEDGTRKEVPRVSLPFQVIETINGSRTAQKIEES